MGEWKDLRTYAETRTDHLKAVPKLLKNTIHEWNGGVEVLPDSVGKSML